MQNGLKAFTQLCLSAKNEDLLLDIFKLFLTQEERESIASRYLIVQELLKQEKTQREMAEYLQVSIAKITRGSNELKRTPSAMIEFLKKNIQQLDVNSK